MREREERMAEEDRESATPTSKLTIVGIGASAGGIKALGELFEARHKERYARLH